MHAQAGVDVDQLMPEVATLIVEALNLDVAPGDIEPDAALYGDTLGLDSIDMLEMSLVISKQYGFEFRSDGENNQVIFGSLKNLCVHIVQQRTK